MSEIRIPNVSRKVRNAMRRERRLNRSVEDVHRSKEHRDLIISKPRNQHQKELAERYKRERFVYNEALKLWNQYRDHNIPWSQCVQAIKTDWVENLHAKWSQKANKSS